MRNDAGDERRVLLVISDNVILNSLQQAFDDEGWLTSVADSAENGLYIFSVGTFDLIIADEDLPVSSGAEFAAKIRADDACVVIMMLTGSSSEPATIFPCVDGYIQKPVRDVLRLTARVRTIVKRKRRDRARPADRSAAQELSFCAIVLCADEPRCEHIVSSLEGHVDHVKVVSDLAGAQRHLAYAPCHLAFVDQSVLDLVKVIRAIKMDKPQLAVTVFGQALGPPVVMQLIELGVGCFIAQPLGSELCSERVADIVSQARPRDRIA